MTTTKKGDNIKSPQGDTGNQPTPQTVNPNDWNKSFNDYSNMFQRLIQVKFPVVQTVLNWTGGSLN